MEQRSIGIAFLLVFISALTTGLIVSILPIFIRYELNSSLTLAGLLMSLISVPQLLIRLPLSLLSDRVGRRPLMAIGLSFYGLSYFAYSLVQSSTQLAVFIFLLGIGMAAYWPASLAYLGDLLQSNQKKRSGRIVGAYTAAFGGAYTIGSLIGGFTVENFGFILNFRLASIIAFTGVCIAIIGVKDISEIKEDAQKRSYGLSLQHSLKVITTNVGMIFVMITIFVSATIQPAIAVFFPLFAKSLGTGEALIGFAIMVNTGFSTIARIPGGQLSDQVNTFWLVGGGLLCQATGILLIPILPGLPGMLLSLSLAGIGSGILLSATMTMIVEFVQPSERGFAMGLEGTLRHIGRVVAPIIMGVVAERSGLPYTFLLGALIGNMGLLGVILILKIINRPKRY